MPNENVNRPTGGEIKMRKFTEKTAGEWLHNLAIERPSTSSVKKVIDFFPDILLYEDKNGELPIQKSTGNPRSIKYIVLLAEEASRRDIGLERGGLLLPNPRAPEFNILQSMISIFSHDSHGNDKIEDLCISSLKALRNAELFIDEDVAQFNLLSYAMSIHHLHRLEFLINIYPTILSTPHRNGNYPIQNMIKNHTHVFEIFLKNGMKYYPETCGFLFRKRNGTRAIYQVIDTYGRNRALDAIQRVISSTEDYPILHYVLKYTPDLADDFVRRYPNALFVKDRKGRYLLHAAVKRGTELSSSLMMTIHSNKQCLEEKDPVTSLYPFMLAATMSRFPKDLTTIYYLLRYCPSVMIRCSGDENTDAAQ